VHGEVRYDEGSRALYTTDASNYRQVPPGVVLPKDGEDVAQTVALCRYSGAPLLNRGGGTSVAGQTCNVAVVMDMSKYLRAIFELDPASAWRASSRAWCSTICATRRSFCRRLARNWRRTPAWSCWNQAEPLFSAMNCSICLRLTDHLLSEFLEKQISPYQLPHLARKAVVHGPPFRIRAGTL